MKRIAITIVLILSFSILIRGSVAFGSPIHNDVTPHPVSGLPLWNHEPTRWISFDGNGVHYIVHGSNFDPWKTII